MPEARSDGCRLWFEIGGPRAAPPLLLANSIGTTIDLWGPQLPAWTDRFRLLRYDTRGHGRSEATPGPYALDQLGRDALAVLDAAGIERAAVCGLSLGGLTAQWLALHAPSRVERLVLANTAARIGTRESWATRIGQVAAGGMASIVDRVLALWFSEEFRRREPAVVARFAGVLADCPVDGYVGCCAALRDADLRDQLGGVTIPVLVIVGARDRATPPADGAALGEALAEARLLSLDAAHLANVEQPAGFAAAVVDFLRP
jgi:3-oxoadipate enol-lactonase